MDLVRDLLLKIADDALPADGWDEKKIYHVKMLCDICYVEGIVFLQTSSSYEYGLVNPQLTWSGHEFLDTIRSKTVWDRIKGLLNDKGVDLSVEAIKLAVPNVLSALIK
jgi:hypothetical protein